MNMKIKLWKQINQADTGGVGKAFQKEKKDKLSVRESMQKKGVCGE